MPVITGNVARLFTEITGNQDGEFSHVANIRPQKDFITYFRRTLPTSEFVFLNRYTYTDVKGAIDNSVVPGDIDVDPYAEILTDAGVLNSDNVDYNNYLYMADGNNKEMQ